MNQLILHVRDARSQGWREQRLTISRVDDSESAGYPALDDPQVAVGSRGDAAVVWDSAVFCVAHCVYRLHAVFRAAGSDTWSPEVEIAPDEHRNLLGQSVAIDAAGNTYAVWLYAPLGGTAPAVIRAASKPAGQPWRQPVSLFTFAADAGVTAPSFAMDARGDAVLAWWVDFGADRGAYASVRPAGGTWSRAVRLGRGQRELDARALIDEHGDALVSWGTSTGTSSVPHLAWYSPATRRWSNVRQSGLFTVPKAMAPNGNAIAAWSEGGFLETAFKPSRSAAWSSPVPQESQAGETVGLVAFDEHNRAIALLSEPGTNGTKLLVTDLAGSGPVITLLTTPPRIRTHRGGIFSVGVFAWDSPLRGKPRWSFGDGAFAKGRTVRHVYRHRGIYTVTVTARDARSGVASAAARVSVTGPP